MNINDLIAIIKKKLQTNIILTNIKIEDKSFLHKKHSGFKEGKFHLKLYIQSEELMKISKIESNKKIYKILDKELKEHIHSIQILIS
tara:strand:- start:1781 stop:2041 length:261 start_codon:yes stop_codon:yes gene_type:complete